MLLLGLMIHYYCGVTSWAQLMFIVVDIILLNYGSSSNVAANGQVLFPDNTSMLLVIVTAWKN
jgi:hypothetical protein